MAKSDNGPSPEMNWRCLFLCKKGGLEFEHFAGAVTRNAQRGKRWSYFFYPQIGYRSALFCS